ncbi:MAG: Rep catalytic domain protein [Geminiviridae sp.]|nr:MAG: Rep catalytic domain protein [Geminiviridae sp.]
MSETKINKEQNVSGDDKKEGVHNDYYETPLTKDGQEFPNLKLTTEDGQKLAINKENGKPMYYPPDPNYGKDYELYSKKLLTRQHKKHFITIPQSKQNHQELFDNLTKCSKNIEYLCVAREPHSKLGDHYHILICCCSKGILIGQIHKAIMRTWGDIGGSVNYQKVKKLAAVETYVKKGNNFLEHGELEVHDPASAGSSTDIDKALHEIYNNEQTLDENILIIADKYPSYYTINYEAIVARLQAKENVKQQRWTIPRYHSANTKLKPYQQRIWELINEPPTNRRIIWVQGKPNSGKSFMFNYIAQNYKYGIYSAGSTASLDNAVYGYDGEGAICWDIPLNYNFKELGDHLASTIEKFSDFGQSLTSRKYKGKKIDVRGHVIVFSNRHCLTQLEHRDIIRINTRDDESEDEKLDTYNITKRTTKSGKTVWIESQPTDDGTGTERTTYHNKADLPIHVLEDVYNN